MTNEKNEASRQWVVCRNTARGNIYEDTFSTREEAEAEMAYMEPHKREFQIDHKGASIWIEEA